MNKKLLLLILIIAFALAALGFKLLGSQKAAVVPGEAVPQQTLVQDGNAGEL